MNYLNENMYRNPQIASQIMTTKQVRETLLNTNNYIIACGRGWKLKITNIGAGMKEVRLKLIVNK